MEILVLIIFFILFSIYCIYAKSDLYAHEHESDYREEIKKFETNYTDLENLDIEQNYLTGDNHLYNDN